MKKCWICGNAAPEEKGDVYFGHWTCGKCINEEEQADETRKAEEAL